MKPMMKDLTNGGFPTANTANGGKTDYAKSGQTDGTMTRSSSGVSKATSEKDPDFAKGGSPTTPTVAYPKSGPNGKNTFKDSVAAAPNKMPKVR